jgi:hypothetical protein
MHPMPMMTDAANEKIVRRDMITVLPRLPKTRIPPAPSDLEQIAPESRNLPPQHCALCHGFVDLDQPRHLGTASIGTIHLTCRRVSKVALARELVPSVSSYSARSGNNPVDPKGTAVSPARVPSARSEMLTARIRAAEIRAERRRRIVAR